MKKMMSFSVIHSIFRIMKSYWKFNRRNDKLKLEIEALMEEWTELADE